MRAIIKPSAADEIGTDGASPEAFFSPSTNANSAVVNSGVVGHRTTNPALESRLPRGLPFRFALPGIVLSGHPGPDRAVSPPQPRPSRPVGSPAAAPNGLLDRGARLPRLAPLVYTGSGSGDKTFDWVLAFSVLSAAALGTGIWSALDRRRGNYITLHKWFYLFLRFAVASEMLLYGTVKVVPLQMPYPFLARLVEPFGNFSPMGVLWYSVGAAPAYEMFVGAAEMLGGILLIFPRTTTLGALICLADTTEVFVLNMTYDVPVKLFGFHLVLMTLVLLAPPASPPRELLFLGSRRRPVHPSPTVPHAAHQSAGPRGTTRVRAFARNHERLRRLEELASLRRRSAQVAALWHLERRDQPVSVSARDLRASHHGDVPAPGRYARQLWCYRGHPDRQHRTHRGADRNWKASLKYQQVGRGQLILDGEMDGRKLRLDLRLLDRNQFLLVSRGFHWIQEYPFNR